MKLTEIEKLIEPTNFSPFAIITKAGYSMNVPNWEFVDIPPNNEDDEIPSYVIVFSSEKVPMPKLIDLNAIDHIRFIDVSLK